MVKLGVREWLAVGRLFLNGHLLRTDDGLRLCRRFEAELAKFTGAEHALAVSSGTAGLICALQACGIGPGDEVLVPAYTWMATAGAVLLVGAVPVLVEIDETLTMDVADLRAKLTQRSRAVIPVHMINRPCDMDAILALARDHGLRVIEDASQAVGVRYKGRMCGTMGDAGVYSFNQHKNMTCGEGGAILTNDTDLAKRAKHLTTTARVPDRWNFVHDAIGFNYRMPNINAALGCAQLERVPDMLARKRVLAQRYAEAFAKVDGASLLEEPEGTTSNYWLCALLLDEEMADQHEAVLAALNDAQLMARPVWTLMHLLPMFAEAPRADLSCAESLASRIVNIPSSPNLVIVAEDAA